MNPEEFDERMNDPERLERERRERLKPKTIRFKVATPNLEDHATADGLGILDVDLKHAFISKYGHLFCMDDSSQDSGKSELSIYREETGMWTTDGVREAINAWMGTMWKDVIREGYAATQAALNLATPEDRDRLTRELDQLRKLVIRWSRANTIAAISTMAYNHLKTLHMTRRVTMNPDRLKLNCANGLLDLRTGELSWWKPSDYLTRSTRTVYDPDIDYKWFEDAVRKIFDGDDQIYEFAHKWFGYCCTGLRRDHALMILFGKTRNGKSLLIDSVATCLGSYAYKLPLGFLESKRNTDNNDQFALAGLDGIRFAHGSETREHSDLRPEVIKSITGDDTINARSSHQNYKTTQSTHKITLATNYKPIIVAEDDAVWARVYLTATPARFGPEEEVEAGTAKYLWDQLLLEKCKTPEGRSVLLRWMVSAVPKYLAYGIKVPDSIKRQIAAHRQEMDEFGAFIQEATEYIGLAETSELDLLAGSGGSEEKRAKWAALKEGFQRREVSATALFAMYRRWCDAEGIKMPRKKKYLLVYCKERERVWIDDEVEPPVEYKMPPMKVAHGKTGPNLRWVRLSPRGVQLYREANGSGSGAELDQGAEM
jgi:P4 family phage/plasmid primase-like protien